MAEWSSFFNSYDGDRKYTAAEFVEYFTSFIGNGVFNGGTDLKVNAAGGMDVSVAVGKGWINGYYYINRDAPKTLTISAAHATMPRIDRVVLRLDLSRNSRYIRALVKTGTAAGSPIAPTLQRDSAIWELSLATVRVNAGATVISQSNITDTRLNASQCGVVAALVKQPDLTAIFNQYQDKFEEVESHWDTWFAGTKGEWNDLKTLFNGWFNQIKAELFSQVNTNFSDWSRWSGYNRNTVPQSNGIIKETLVNRSNNTTLATKTTEMLPNGNIKETMVWTNPVLTVTKTTTMNADGSVTEVIT